MANQKPVTHLRDLILDNSNYRIHSPRNVGMIEKALHEVGAARSIVVDEDGVILAGNATIEAAAAAGIEKVQVVDTDGETIIAVRRSGLTPEQKRKLALFDNRTAELAEWDADMLGELAKEVDLSSLWTGDELQALLVGQNGQEIPEDPGPQLDKAEELRKKWHVETGQLWSIGEHRLLCGDATKREDVERVMGGEKADIVFTDPPYNVAGENEIIAAGVSKAMSDLKAAEWDHDFDLRPSLEIMLFFLAQDVTVYICTSHHLAPTIWGWMKEWAAHHSWCAWEKPNPMPSLSKRHWTWNAELVAYATRGKHVFHFPSEGHALSIWRFNKHKETEHPTEKPIEVVEHALSHSSNKGMLIFDPFLGSGTTMVAAHRLHRRCYGIEIDPGYCGVILERMSGLGLIPVLSSC